jgi:general secretion pathway protein C
MTDGNSNPPNEQPEKLPTLQEESQSTGRNPPELISPSSSLHGEHAPLISEPATKGDWKAQLSAHLDRLKQSQWARDFGMRLQHFEPMQAAEWASRTFQRQEMGFYGKALTIGLCAFFLADVTALLLGRFVPEPPAARPVYSSGSVRRPHMIEDYSIIFTRNLFNSRGLIPGEEAAPDNANPDQGGAPVRTTLPLNLVGTLIMQDENRSIATIEDKTATMVYPVRVGDEIPSKARILKIETRKVTFVNTSNGRREFVDLPEDDIKIGNPRVTVGGGGGKGPGIEQVAPNQYNINRAEVDKTLSDLNNVLTQARAVPNFENGVPNGYKLFQIVPGSIYDKLGLKNGDVIAGLNGQAINDPGQAFQMLSELKTANHLELQVKKDGKLQTNSYDIR